MLPAGQQEGREIQMEALMCTRANSAPARIAILNTLIDSFHDSNRSRGSKEASTWKLWRKNECKRKVCYSGQGREGGSERNTKQLLGKRLSKMTACRKPGLVCTCIPLLLPFSFFPPVL
jgi:hypothetical protein